MSLFESLKDSSKFLVSENDGGSCSVSSDSIARVPSKTGKMKRRAVKKVRIVKMLDESTDFDSTHVSSVLSKLSAVGNSTPDTEVKDFGFADSEGNIIKVSVDASQADDFKNTLSRLLADYTENEQSIEVAEVLFNLRNKFNIVDVKWPKVVEDEEPVQTGSDAPDDINATNPEVDDVNADIANPTPPQAGADQSGAMDAMLSALIADAEARRQEAVARAAEARAKEADAAARMSAQKMSAEEEVADMEAFYTSQNEEQKEAKKLAKLAKYRHQMRKAQQDLQSTAYSTALDNQDDDNFMGMDTGEDEKDPSLNQQAPKITPADTDPTTDLDKEVKADENEEVTNSGQHSNLLKALMAMRHKGVRT